MKLFTLIKTDLKSFILLAISIVLTLVGMIMYIVTTKQMNTHISPLMLIVSIIVGYGIMPAFVVGGILYILSVVTTSVAAFLEK